MNKITKFLGAAIALIALTVSAQFVQGPSVGSALVTTTPFLCNAITTTNVATAYQMLIPVGPLGVGFQIEMGATNSVSTTNATITFEGTVDGTYWIDSPTTALPVFSVPQNGTSPYTVYTNMTCTTVAAQNLGNIRYLRVKSIQNTNIASIWITNFYWSVR